MRLPEWIDYPLWKFGRWLREVWCRIFGHLPSKEVTSHYGSFTQTMDCGFNTTRIESERGREIVRYCPRCGETENSVKVVTDSRRQDFPPQTIEWSENCDPEVWR